MLSHTEAYGSFAYIYQPHLFVKVPNPLPAAYDIRVCDSPVYRYGWTIKKEDRLL
jgi:hypothetical protein